MNNSLSKKTTESDKKKERSSRRESREERKEEKEEKEKEEREKEREKKEEREKRRESRHMSMLGADKKEDVEVKSPISSRSFEVEGKPSRKKTKESEEKLKRMTSASVEDCKTTEDHSEDQREDDKGDTKNEKKEKKTLHLESSQSLRLSEIVSLQEASQETSKASPRIRSLDLAFGKRHEILSLGMFLKAFFSRGKRSSLSLTALASEEEPSSMSSFALQFYFFDCR
jgi:hypothetical protein